MKDNSFTRSPWRKRSDTRPVRGTVIDYAIVDVNTYVNTYESAFFEVRDSFRTTDHKILIATVVVHDMGLPIIVHKQLSKFKVKWKKIKEKMNDVMMNANAMNFMNENFMECIDICARFSSHVDLHVQNQQRWQLLVLEYQQRWHVLLYFSLFPF